MSAAWFIVPAFAQTTQKGIDDKVGLGEKLRVEYVGYRPAVYETKALVEPENERPNKGGIIYVYVTNVSKTPVRLAFYRCNGKDVSHWLLGAYFAWDRVYHEQLEPGQMTVQEINAVTDHFAEGKPFVFSYIDRTWVPVCMHSTRLVEDPIQVSLIRVLRGMDGVEVHVRNKGGEPAELQSLEVIGHPTRDIAWVGRRMPGGSHAIARVRLQKPLAPAELVVVRAAVEQKGRSRSIYAHRRAFEDWFPIGCWSADPQTYEVLRRLHVELVVQGGTAEHEFYARSAATYGFRSMCPTGTFEGLDTIRSLADHPAVACWMLADEPDWSTPPVVMKHSDAFVRHFNRTKPTFITLCRNVKFFEYGPIADIPCMDHYCVTAPTSSKWPFVYGTRLEETGYYTRDLKRACEPKPIWVWSQAIATWSERPKRPVPTPDELAAQLLFNMGRGAKGILWFNYEHKVAERFPDTREAMRRWGRVLRVTRDDLLSAEPVEAEPTAPEKVDAATLVSWDKLIVCVVNLDYRIHPEAYPFNPRRNVEVSCRLPDWIKPAVALDVSPDGITKVPFEVTQGRIRLTLGDLNVCRLIVVGGRADTLPAYERTYAKAVQDER